MSAKPPPNGATAREKLAETARDLYARGWCLGTSGNFSAVFEDAPGERRIVISASGRDKGRLDPGGFVEIDLDGHLVGTAGEGPVPSAEALLHATLVRRAGAGAVLHTHSVAGTLLGQQHLRHGSLTLRGFEMLKGLEWVESHETSVALPVLPNDPDIPALARHLEALLDEQGPLHGFLIAGHGLYTWGRTLEAARRHVEVLEFMLECVARRTAFEPYDA
jgi:methylthioribulose-1-phosphate dehydratase